MSESKTRRRFARLKTYLDWLFLSVLFDVAVIALVVILAAMLIHIMIPILAQWPV